MKNLILFIAFAFLHTIPALSQDSRLIEGTQSLTTYAFMHALEKGDVATASKLLDSTSLNKNKYKDSLALWHKELIKHLKKIELSVMIDPNEKKYNHHTCIYTNKDGLFFEIDLYYKTTVASSPIVKIVKTPEKELERIRKIKDEPPPPPPPPGVEIKPARKNR